MQSESKALRRAGGPGNGRAVAVAANGTREGGRARRAASALGVVLSVVLAAAPSGPARSQTAAQAPVAETPAAAGTTVERTTGTAAGEGTEASVGAAPDAQTVTEESGGTSAPNWLVSCTNTGSEGSLTCEMSQSVVMSDSGARILTATVRPGADPTRPTLLMTLPHGLFLPAGVVLAIDGGRRDPLPIETCDAAGCYLGLVIEPDLLAALEKGAELHVLMESLQRQEIDLTLTLDGFAGSLETMRR